MLAKTSVELRSSPKFVAPKLAILGTSFTPSSAPCKFDLIAAEHSKNCQPLTEKSGRQNPVTPDGKIRPPQFRPPQFRQPLTVKIRPPQFRPPQFRQPLTDFAAHHHNSGNPSAAHRFCSLGFCFPQSPSLTLLQIRITAYYLPHARLPILRKFTFTSYPQTSKRWPVPRDKRWPVPREPS